MHLRLPSGPDRFAEDKDEAKLLRKQSILPTLDAGKPLVLDFQEVSYTTQSFVHVLINEALHKHGESALGLIEFKNCTPQVRSVIELVVDYSLGGFQDPQPLQPATVSA